MGGVETALTAHPSRHEVTPVVFVHGAPPPSSDFPREEEEVAGVGEEVMLKRKSSPGEHRQIFLRCVLLFFSLLID